MKHSETQIAQHYLTNVREIAEALGIPVSPNEYVELVGSQDESAPRLASRVTVRLIRSVAPRKMAAE